VTLPTIEQLRTAMKNVEHCLTITDVSSYNVEKQCYMVSVTGQMEKTERRTDGIKVLSALQSVLIHC